MTTADEKLAAAQARQNRVVVHKHIWLKDGPISPESLMLLASEGWTVWRAIPSGSSPTHSKHHFYDLVRDITDE